MLILGEVHTGLLMNSTAISRSESDRMLAFTVGEQVNQAGRPMPTAISPTRLTGVDCDLTGRSGAATRIVGTVESRCVLTGGRVLQGSAWLHVEPGDSTRRLPWSHYLARPGRAETIGKFSADLGTGFLGNRTASALDLAAICARAREQAHNADLLDFVVPFRAPQTKVRWFATTRDDDERAPSTVVFGIQDESVRTVHLQLPAESLADVVDLCEIVALHDWLLTAQQHLIGHGFAAAPSADSRTTQLRQAVELLHLWMPEARMRPAWSSLWEALDLKAGMTLQWTTSVNRIRDALSLALLDRPPTVAGARPDGSVR